MARSNPLDQPSRVPVGPSTRILRNILGRIDAGRLTLETGDDLIVFEGVRDGPDAHMRVHSPTRFLARVWLHGALGIGESFVAGEWDSDDLSEALESLALNEPCFGRPSRPNALARLRVLLEHRRRKNSPRGSQRNIEAHYDLGNAFYRTWLDDSMTYSAAIFSHEDECLGDAQHRKYATILDRLELKQGDRILEIGCGWGGLAIEAARRGAHVTGLTLSREQLDFARKRIADVGLSDNITLRLQDYRDVREQFDHVVSIEMFEAVGKEYWPAYFEAVADALKPGGRAALQVITIDPEWYHQYLKTPDFIQRYVFPGGMLPTMDIFSELAETAGLCVADLKFYGSHYARTLKRWHQRFLAALHQVEELGYDQRFQRIWRYYLSYCEAGFRAGRIDLMQATLIRPASMAGRS